MVTWNEIKYYGDTLLSYATAVGAGVVIERARQGIVNNESLEKILWNFAYATIALTTGSFLLYRESKKDLKEIERDKQFPRRLK